MTGVIRSEKFLCRYTGRMPCEDGGRDLCNALSSQGRSRIACHHQKLGMRHGIKLSN